MMCNLAAFSQKHELNFSIGYGLTNIFKTSKSLGNLNYDYNRVTNHNYLGAELMYGYTIIEKRKIVLTTGASFNNTSFYQKIFDKTLKNIDNIYIKSSHINLNIIGINKLINLYDDKIKLSIGFTWIERLFFKKSKIYSTEYINSNESWVKYRYNLTTYQSNFFTNDSNIKRKDMHFNFKYNVSLNYKLTSKMYLNFGFQYIRNYIFFYDYNYDVLYYHNNSSVPTDSYSFIGYTNDTKFGVKSNFLCLKFGTSYKF